MRVSVAIDLLEDPTLQPGQVQEMAPVPYPSVVSIRGATLSCGFDDQSDEYQWPVHQVIGPDGPQTVQTSGWYTGDVDLYSLGAGGRGWVSASLEWDNMPPGESNAPYLPDDQDAAWHGESDLDFVLFDVGSLALGTIVNDDGFSLSYPEQSQRRVLVDPDNPPVIAVACHHQLPTGYTLVLDFRNP